MSVVTNIILSFGLGGGPAQLDEVNRYISENERGAGFVSLDDESLPIAWYGGSKMLECYLSVGAYNAFNLDAFIAFLKTVEWGYPEDIQIIVREQEDIRFRIINLFDEAP